MPTSRYPNGVSTSDITETLGNFIAPDPTKAYVFLDDFSTFDTADWRIAHAGDGAFALADGQGGNLELSIGNATISSIKSSVDSFQLTEGKETWFKTSLFTPTVSSGVSVASMEIGLFDNSSFDGIFFVLSTGGITLDMQGGLVASITTVTTDQPFQTTDAFQLGFYYNGNGILRIYLNDESVASISSVNLPFGIPLPVTFSYSSTEVSAQLLDIDYFYAAQER